MHDLLIRGGRIVDPETGFGSAADVAIRDGTIVAVEASAETHSQF